MNYIKIPLLLFMIFLVTELCAQHKGLYENSGICLTNSKTQRQKVIHIYSKVKYCLNRSNKASKGRIAGIKDSSIILMNGSEIKFEDIRKIGLRDGMIGPIIAASLFCTPVIFPIIFINNRNYDMVTKWRFTKSINPAIDSMSLKRYNEIVERKINSQKDSSNTFSLTLNPLNCLFNQCTLEIGYHVNNKFSIGVGGGIVYKNMWYHDLYDGTDNDYPTGVYKGWLMTANFKSLNINKSHWYFETNLFYKYLYYDHVHFINGWGDDDPDVEWIRSEIANVYGIKILLGKRNYVSNHIALEPVFGISLRCRSRSFITFWQNHPSYNVQDDPLGAVLHRDQILPGLHAGLLITFGNFKIN